MNGEDFKRLEQIIVSFKDEVKAEFRHQLGIQSENFQHKLDIVVEGHEVLRKEIRDTREELCEKIKFVDFKVEVLNQKIDDVHDELNQKIDSVEDRLGRKIDAVATDLSAHRRDTEAHPTVYKVKEGS
jgi:archaellum component FlaC